MRGGRLSKIAGLGLLVLAILGVSASASTATGPTLDFATARLLVTSGGRSSEGVINFRLHRDWLFVGADPMGDSELFGVPKFTEGEAIDAAGVSYVKVRPSSDGPSWYRKDHSGDVLAIIDERPYQDPSTLLAFLESVCPDLHREDVEYIRKVPTTRYSGSIDTSRVLELIPPELRDTAREDIAFRFGESKTGATPILPVEAWVDEHGVARRLRMTESGFTTTWEYFDFGVKASIRLPSKSEIMSSADMDAYLRGSK